MISQQRPDVYAIRVNRAACTRIHLQLLQQHRQPRLQRSPFVRSGSIAGSCRAGSKQSRRSKRLSDTMIRCTCGRPRTCHSVANDSLAETVIIALQRHAHSCLRHPAFKSGNEPCDHCEPSQLVRGLCGLYAITPRGHSRSGCRTAKQAAWAARSDGCRRRGGADHLQINQLTRIFRSNCFYLVLNFCVILYLLSQ